ncbi:hypothetical protein [Thiomicrospira sp. ALE5]|uniref:hypothetical protein n=1 Tax=Thiomicrospira sp. ALE5 TaxID=748650 RepID=UPI00117D069C|nr:hypothetical protein [Thiomicrospira sp. ALE5]
MIIWHAFRLSKLNPILLIEGESYTLMTQDMTIIDIFNIGDIGFNSMTAVFNETRPGLKLIKKVKHFQVIDGL